MGVIRKAVGLGAASSRLVGIPSGIADDVLSHVRDMLGDLSEKIERIKYLEVPGEGALRR